MTFLRIDSREAAPPAAGRSSTPQTRPTTRAARHDRVPSRALARAHDDVGPPDLEHRETVAQRAFGSASVLYRQAAASNQDQALRGAVDALKQFLNDHPRSGAAAQAWYLLGNLEYRRRALDTALAAFQEASRRDSGSVGVLSRLGAGYVWEAKREPQRALEVYQAALKGRDSKDFAYGELLLALGRVQEELQERDAAVETYRRFLRDVPASGRAEEVRIRLAILGASA